MTIAALVAADPLRMGATGLAMKEIQLALKACGYPLTGTDYFGPQTDTSVEDLQLQGRAAGHRRSMNVLGIAAK